MTVQDRIKSARQTLDSLRKSQLGIESAGGISFAMAVVIIVWLSGTILEMTFHLAATTRLYLLIALLLISLVAFLIVFTGIIRDNRLRPGRYAEEYWALSLGQSAPEKLRDKLLNAIQIYRTRPTDRDKFSEDLASQALLIAVADLENVPMEPALDHGRRNSGLRTLAFAAAIAVVLFIVSPSSMFSSANRLVHPSTEYMIPPSFTLAIDPAGGWAYRGEQVEFSITADGAAPREVEFIFSYSGGDPQIERVPLKDGVGELIIDGFSGPVDYYAQNKRIISPAYKLDIVTRPQVSELQYRLFSPRYSRLPVEVGRDNVGDVEALPGSRLELTMRASKILSEGWLIFTPSGADSTSADSIPFDVRGQSGTTQMGVYIEGRYHIRLRDIKGHQDRDPVTYRIRLLRDELPTVRIVFPDADIELGEDMTLPLQIEADDDFGISRLQLAFQKIGEDSSRITSEIQTNSLGEATISVDYLWNLADLGLMPGEVLEYWIIAHDNDNVKGSKLSESERRLVRLPSIEEIVAGIENAERESIDQAEMTLEAAKELREHMQEIIEEMRRNPEVDWERRRDIESAVEQQDAIEQNIDKLAEKINELVDQLQKHDLAMAETLEKYMQLQELIAEISTPELKEAMEKLKQALESQDPDKVRQALEQFDLDREEFLQSIERSIDILEQLRLERKMDELVKQVEELLHRQESVLQQMDSVEANELAEQQDALAQMTELFEKSLEETAESIEQAGEEQLASQLESIADSLDEKDIPSRMKETAQDMNSGRMDMARSKGQQSARDLSQLLAQLSAASKEFKERRKSEIAGKLRRLVEELLYVSQDQEELADRSKRLGTQSPQYRSLAGQQEDIRNALSGIINRLFEVSKETFFVTPDLGATLGNASKQMEKALEGYTSRNPRSVGTPQSKGLGEVNIASKKIIDILGQLQGSSSSTGYEEMIERLSQMASAQQSLNQQSMPIPGAEGEGMMPGADQLARMAAQQRALQEQMQQLGEEGEGMREILGDLDGIAKNMGDVAEDLENRNVNERTRRLQRRIVSRLLDATRSVRQQEYSRKRESRSGQDVVRKSPAELDLESDREKLRRDLMRALQEGYTRDFRRLIREYFQSLEQLETDKQPRMGK